MRKPTIRICENKGADSFAVTAKLISAFVFAIQIVQFLLDLTPKFQASSLLLCLYRPVCVGPVRKPHCWFSHEAAHILTTMKIFILIYDVKMYFTGHILFFIVPVCYFYRSFNEQSCDQISDIKMSHSDSEVL